MLIIAKVKGEKPRNRRIIQPEMLFTADKSAKLNWQWKPAFWQQNAKHIDGKISIFVEMPSRYAESDNLRANALDFIYFMKQKII